MAIFSLRHTPIGRTTQAQPYTAGAHVKYITRPQAARHVMAERMPARPGPAATYLKQMENGDRANARVADKVMLALPKELNQEQRVQLVREYANDVTRSKAPWLAAIHDRGKDARNPHCHLLIRDRDASTGRRVIGMSDPGSTEMLREKWQKHANRALERAGHAARIDRRTLREQGIQREPTIHEGPNVRAMQARGARPRSRPRDVRNGIGARKPLRRVDYPTIDRGRTRPEYNRSLRPTEKEADYWEAIDQDKQRREFAERGLGADYARWERHRHKDNVVRLQPQPAKRNTGSLPPASPQQPRQEDPKPPIRNPISKSAQPSKRPGSRQEPDWVSMSPDERQARQQKGLEEPAVSGDRPRMAPAPPAYASRRPNVEYQSQPKPPRYMPRTTGAIPSEPQWSKNLQPSRMGPMPPPAYVATPVQQGTGSFQKDGVPSKRPVMPSPPKRLNNTPPAPRPGNKPEMEM